METILPWEKNLNHIQNQLVNYLAQVCVRFTPNISIALIALTCSSAISWIQGVTGEEIIVKEGAICLTREEFWSLGLRRNMESNVSRGNFLKGNFDFQHYLYLSELGMLFFWPPAPFDITGVRKNNSCARDTEKIRSATTSGIFHTISLTQIDGRKVEN